MKQSQALWFMLCLALLFLAFAYGTPKQREPSTKVVLGRFKLISSEGSLTLRFDVYEDALTKRTFLVTKDSITGGATSVTLLP